MSDVDTWPDADVAYQGVFEAWPDMAIPFAVHVFVFHDVAKLQAACGDPLAYAYSRTYDEPDAAGVQAVLMFAPPVTLSQIVHEVTHAALFWARGQVGPHQRARRWLHEHPEAVPELVGNLSAVLWHSLATDFLEQ